jgi:hypothetical protein
MTDLEKLRYPIGRYTLPDTISEDDIRSWISTIDAFPEKLEKLTNSLTNKQLNTCYRDQGWTVRQVIHHCYDSHHNSYTRFKWALTEHAPMIKAYDEAAWCALPDSKEAPIELSLVALKGLHAKWVYLLNALSAEELDSTFIHPENGFTYTLKQVISLYAWHCDHHFAHIDSLVKRMGW